jgi:hypothetical protein
MKKFVKRLFFFFLPAAVLFSVTVFLYYKRDVYADFEHTEDLNWRYFFQQLGDLSTKKLLASSVPYNSFIFGSSRSCSIYACYLQKHQKGSEYFHYGNWNESIGGICSKLRTVDSLGYPIRNVVMYLDATVSFEGNGSVNPSDHYLLTGEKKQQYIIRHFKSFFSNLDADKLKILLGIPVSGGIYPNDILDPVRNDYNHLCSEEVISKYSQVKDDAAMRRIVDSLSQSGFMHPRPKIQQYCDEQIGSDEQRYLKNIAGIFSRHQTRFWIIMTPLYDQKKLHPSDSSLLRKYFGQNVYDFSGINVITDNIYNFPDRHHFHASISKAIMDSVVLRSKTPKLVAEDRKK